MVASAQAAPWSKADGITPVPAAKSIVAASRQIGEEAGVSVYTREVPGSDYRAMKAEAILSEPAEKIWRVLSDVERYTEFVGSSPPGPFHAQGYDAANIMFAAIEAAAVENADGSLASTNFEQRVTGTETCCRNSLTAS